MTWSSYQRRGTYGYQVGSGIRRPFKCAEGDDDGNTLLSQFMHQTVFVDYNQRDGVVSNPHSILRVRSRETDLRFEL